MNRTFQIDLTPSFEDGKWVVREEICIDNDRWELCDEYHFTTEKSANDFIDRWIAKNS